MVITQEAKILLNKMFKTNGYDCIKATLQKQSCCGPSLVLSMAKLDDEDKPITIDGISVLMDDEAEERSKTVTLSVKKGRLILQDDAASGCC